MARKKKSVGDTLFFGFGLIFDIIVIISSLFKESSGKN